MSFNVEFQRDWKRGFNVGVRKLMQRVRKAALNFNVGKNSRKLRVLDYLAAQARPASVAEIAWGVRLPYAARGLYSLLGAYARWGLVRRWRGPGGRLVFELTERGLERLAWLNAQK